MPSPSAEPSVATEPNLPLGAASLHPQAGVVGLRVALCALLLMGCGAVASCGADPADTPSKTREIGAGSAPGASAPGVSFTRLRSLGGDDQMFEVSVLRCGDQGDRSVDLVSAVHVADARHYEELNRRLGTYDAVLYELVSDPDVRPYPGMEQPGGPMAMVKSMLKTGLELTYQVEQIDYRPEHFVHADLTQEGFLDEMDRRGETFLSMVFSMMSQSQRGVADRYDDLTREEMDALPETDFVTAAQTGYLHHELRKLVASQLAEVEQVLVGEDQDGSTLLEGRNAKCMEVLDGQLQAGKKRLAIYYGAAHMPDMLARLRARGFTPKSEAWLVAWDLRKRKDGEPPAPLPRAVEGR